MSKKWMIASDLHGSAYYCRLLLERFHLKPEETLFIDDSPQHIEAARKVGINAYHLTGGETIEQLFMCNLELRQGIV